MGFSLENGYVPETIEELMSSLREGVNAQFGTTYTDENFVGTNFYKYFYAPAQEMQANGTKVSEIFLKLQQYFRITNERINRPKVTNQGLIDSLAVANYVGSIKKPIDADAGKLFVCVDTDELADDYADHKLEICEIIKESNVGGVVSQGTEVETLTLSNGQAFDWKFNLPNRIEVLLRLTTTLSENNQSVILSPEETKGKLLDNISARYRLGKNFEPQKYFAVSDAPWTSDVLLEWSDDDGANWHTEVFDANYDDLFTILLENVSLVEE